jgi:hypothetical protein
MDKASTCCGSLKQISSVYTGPTYSSSNTAIVFYLKDQTSRRQEDKFFDGIDGGGHNEFFMKLSHLRCHAEVYLSMLNDMRRRLKELPSDAPTAQQYRNVMRDVTRLLYLLNKKSTAIEIPPDGMQLLSWSEQILQRYLESQGDSPRGTATQIPTRLSAIGDQAETNF